MTATLGFELLRYGVAKGLPKVQGRCPACQGGPLYLAVGGYVSCSSPTCPNPAAAHDQLNRLEQTVDQPGHERCRLSGTGIHSWTRRAPIVCTFCGVPRP